MAVAVLHNAVDQVEFNTPEGHWTFASRAPRLELSDSVIQLWEAVGKIAYSHEKIVPTGSIDLIINLNRPHQTLDIHDLSCTGTFQDAWLSGFHEQALINAPTYDTAQHGSHLIGVTMHAHAARRVFGIGGDSFTNQVVEFSDFQNAAGIERVRDQLDQCDNVATRFDLVESYLWELKAGHRKSLSDCIWWSLNLVHNAHGNISVSALCKETGVSRKHLDQKFRDEMGITPKRYARVIRFSRVIEDLMNRQTINWADIASEAGFYDQAHFIREFRTFSGETPSDFLRVRCPDGKTIIYS